MTLEDFKEIYKDKTPVEMLDLLAEQHATWRHDAVAREKGRDSIDGGAYYANECRAMEARVEWIMGRLKDALKAQTPHLLTAENFDTQHDLDWSKGLPAWVEYRRDGEWGQYWGDTQDEWAVVRKDMLDVEGYRCWTGYPSQRQRNETPCGALFAFLGGSCAVQWFSLPGRYKRATAAFTGLTAAPFSE